MHSSIVASAALAGALLLAHAASAGTLIPVVPVANSTRTVAIGINDNNVITGYYTTSDGNMHGFVGTLAGTYSTFNYPSGRTEGLSVNNDGYVVGQANPSGDSFFGDSFERTPNGNIIPLTKDGVTIDGFTHTIVKGQKFIGEYWVFDQDHNLTILGYYGKGTKYKTDLILPFSTSRTRPRGYNDNGDVVGYYRDDAVQNYPGFVLKGEAVTQVHYPDADAFFTILASINNKGQIAGYWQTLDQMTFQPFLYDLGRNAFKAIKVPGSTVANANAINKAGMVTINSDIGSFIYCSKAKTCPNARGAIHVEDTWIAAGRDTGRWTICKNHCIGPSRPVMAPPISRSSSR